MRRARITAGTTGSIAALATSLVLCLLPGCAPERDCTARVYHLPHDHRVQQVEVLGDMTDWEPTDMDEICPCVWHKAFDLDPGDYLYELRVDGKPARDDLVGLTGWREGDEYSLLRVEDCAVPGWQVDTAATTPDGAFEVELTFLRAGGGAALDADSIVATLGDGTALPVIPGQTGRVTIAGSGLPAGKHTIVVDAADGDGLAAERLLLPLWVEAEPFSWDGAMVYQVVIDRFADADGSLAPPPSAGLRAGGDLPGLLRVMRDGYFEQVGARALWISPVMRNAEGVWPGSDGHEYEGYHGYWPVAQGEVEPAFGTAADLDALVDEAHARGIRILMDVVPNHVHTDHPWYADWSSDRFNGDDGEACVCGSAECPWGEFIQTCWFTPYLADLDWTNPDVVAAQTEEIAWWVERFDLDGLRVDAVPMMPRSATREIVHELQRRFERGPTPLYLVGETFGGATSWGSIQRYLGPFGLDGQFDFPVMWSVRETIGQGGGSLRDLAETLDESELAWAGPDAVMAPMVGNHDVRRFLSEANGDYNDGWTDPPTAPDTDEPYRRLVMAQAVVLTLPGAPVLYYGDEFGMPGARDPDNRRVMRFDEALSEREAWTLDRVAAIGRARACLPALQTGERTTLAADDDVLAYARHTDDGRPALIVINRSDQTLTRSFPVPASIAPDGTSLTDVLGGTSIDLRYGATGPLELLPLSAQVLVPGGTCD